MAYESDFQADLLRWLKRHEIEHWRMPLGPRYVNGGVKGKNPLKGFPDVCGLLSRRHAGQFWALELKTPGTGKIGADQAAWMVRLKAAGAPVAVVVNMAEVILFFRTLGEIP